MRHFQRILPRFFHAREERFIRFPDARKIRASYVVSVLNYAEGTGAKDRFASFGIGLNKKLLPGSLNSVYAEGVVSFGIGDNKDFGGDNEST